MLYLYIFSAIFIAWVWVDYYRLIDVFDREKLLYLIIMFALGCASIFIVFGAHDCVLDDLPYSLNGDPVNDFLYSTIIIGMLEETAKMIPFILFLMVFKKVVNDPIDYLVYVCVSALGFSAVENILYMQNYGPHVMHGRSILSTVGHMFDTALIAYGIILYKFHPRRKKLWVPIVFFLLAALSHGFYDFWLLHQGTEQNGYWITLLYFMVTVSWFATILNNALNNSKYFSYKKAVDSHKVMNRMLFYYLFIFFLQFLMLALHKEVVSAMILTAWYFITVGLIVIVTVVRLSRFKLAQYRWNPIKLELPFHLSVSGLKPSVIPISGGVRVRVKGDSYNEAVLARYYEEFVEILPMSTHRSYIKKPRIIFVDRKLFLKDDDTYYSAKLFLNGSDGEYKSVLIKGKPSGKGFTRQGMPIIALLLPDYEEAWYNDPINIEDFRFKEWCCVRPLND